MARPTPTTITCPNCNQSFNALLEQVLDVGIDPGVRDRLLSNQINVVTCPNCGWNGSVGTPLIYHDPEKKLAIVHVPMQIDMDTQEREVMIGQLTNAVMQNLPEDAPKGYLLQPNTALTMQGLTEQVLEAEGITRDMIDKERRKVTIIDELARADDEERDRLLEENAELIDETFIELLTVAAQGASQAGNQRQSLRLLNVRSELLENTEVGQRVKQREAAQQEAVLALQAIAEDGSVTRDDFVDLIVDFADDPDKIQALAQVGYQLLDYTTFQMLAEEIDQASGEHLENLEAARETLLEVASAYEEQNRAVIQRAANTLRTILSAQNVAQAVRENAQQIDETFLQVLQVNLEEARRTGNAEASSKLKQVRDEVLKLIEESAPPEIQFINQMLTVETDEEAMEILHNNADTLSPDFIELMSQLAEQLRAGGNERAAHRLDRLREETRKILS